MKVLNIAVLAIAAAFSACSNIAEDERLIYVEPVEVNRNVLIEDFTGQRCVNCPKATDAINAIHEVYGENIIAVAIHCGQFGVGGAIGLMTDDGKEYWNKWFTSSQGQPVAKINRGAATSDYDNWSADVAKAVEKTTDVKINCQIFYSEENKEVEIDVETKSETARKANLQVWLTEDNITAMQVMPDNSINKEYVHNHVFRAAVNGTWGEEISLSPELTEKSYKNVKLDEKWIPANMHAVIFVYDDSEVLQVIQTPLVAKSE